MNQDKRENGSIWHFFNKLDRNQFIGNQYQELAQHDSPLPIGYGQTISQPSLVCQMTDLLDLSNNLTVLEIGTGSGYQTAFLAEFAAKVYTVERIGELSEEAQTRLGQLGYSNVYFKIGDGSEGWPEFAPYDRIIVTAGAAKLPAALVEQLKPEGKMLIPVGKQKVQELFLIQKDSLGNVTQEVVERVIFVELKGDFGWSR
ncbi:MAG TPA: protein-L-isoaspartate(D-aspartate) O-methyltransferase [Firmicutes bacterium]|jgi:protein-L-isoaspartate(D-aspartate) O-methyltransferase|nr:protein-L-isoaspartate(D-aspartate) O-methyltransferase [Bacillota bacterium]